MTRIRPLRALANAAVVLTVSAAVGATAAGSVAADSFVRTEAYELFTGQDTESWCIGDYDALTVGADLRGPHFAFSYLCRFAEDETPAAVHAAFAGTPALAEGTELLAVQSSLEPVYLPEVGAEAVDVWIEVGPERIDLAGLPVAFGYLAVAVPAGEDAVLWVEDDGRAQGLSLRTGDRVEPVASYYNGLASEAVDTARYEFADVQVRNSSRGGTALCGGYASATRQTWHPELGWAAEGTSFLTVELNWCHVLDDGSGTDVLRWELDPELALVSADGTPTPLQWTEDPGEDDRLLVAAVFAVPEDLAELRLDFVPLGDLHDLVGGGDYYFGDTPEAAELVFRF
ncbi:hypothetical protein GCM10009853_034410 [Glycomyces scopariae]